MVLAPFHIQAVWGTGGGDLDLHLTGPQGGSTFHVYYSNKGSLTSQPYAQLQRDCTSSGGSEVITVGQFNQGDVYRASVFNYCIQSDTGTNLSTTSGVSLQVIKGGSVIDRVASGGGLGSIVSGGTTVTPRPARLGTPGGPWKLARPPARLTRLTRLSTHQALRPSDSKIRG